MSTLKWYKLVFKQLAPIHIGNFRWGVVNQTEIFIPGQVIWGALVKRYMELKRITNTCKVEKTKKHFEVISNFFPSFDGNNILEPHYRDGEFHLGDFSEREFRFLFTFADFRTSIEPIFRKAKDEHLYEFEYISPFPIKENLESLKKRGEKNGNLEILERFLREGKPLRWVGIIGIPKEEKDIEEFLKEGLKIWVGGDIRYGFGELVLENITEISKETQLKEWNVTPEGALDYSETKSIKNFISLDYLKEIEQGEIKLLVKLSFDRNIPRVEKECSGFYAWVGSTVKINGCKPLLKCGKFG